MTEVSPDGRWIAHPTLQEPKVTLIDLATGQAKFILQFARKDKEATLFLPWLLFSPDSKHFTAYDPAFESLIVWDVNTGQSRIVIPSPSASLTIWLGIPAEAAFSPDSRLFAVCIDATTLELLDVYTGQIRSVFSDSGQLAFSPDGRLLAVSSGSTIRIWDVQTQQRMIELPGGGPVAFSPDGHWLAAVNGLILHLWSVPG
jgi:WD40 repeat protein